MAKFGVKLQFDRRIPLIREAQRRARNLPMDKVPPAMRRSVRREFASKSWAMPSGGSLRWQPTKPFGECSPGASTLKRSGTLFRAWSGGAGSVTRVTAKTATIGVNPVTVPYAEYHRGMRGGRIDASHVFVIKPKKVARNSRGQFRSGPGHWAMFWYLGLTCGVWLSAETLRRGLRLPVRPHATNNPRLRKEILAIFRKHLLSA